MKSVLPRLPLSTFQQDPSQVQRACGVFYRADVGQTCIDGLWSVVKCMRGCL
jgi:hypothetical protein